MKKTVTDAYLLGVKEARELLRALPDMTLEEMQGCLSTAQLLIPGSSPVMAETYRGERDFWREQIKKREGK